MSHLLLDWLNNDIQLSKIVTDFSEDFKDGFLFCEILFRYNQLDKFEKKISKANQLTSKTSRGHGHIILENYTMLEEAFRKLNITFNSRIAAKIINGDDHITKNLLYELKSVIEKLCRNTRVALPPRLWGTRNDRVINVLGTTRPSYDDSCTKSFQNAIRSILEQQENKKKIEYDNDPLGNLHSSSNHLGSTAYPVPSMTYEESKKLANQVRAQTLSKSKKLRVDEFTNVWNSIHQDKWKENMKIAKNREKRIEKVDRDIQRIREESLTKHFNNEKFSSISDIDEFEKKIENMRHNMTAPSNVTNNFSYTDSQDFNQTNNSCNQFGISTNRAASASSTMNSTSSILKNTGTNAINNNNNILVRSVRI